MAGASQGKAHLVVSALKQPAETPLGKPQNTHEEELMKKNLQAYIIAGTLLAALAMPAGLVAQKGKNEKGDAHHYKFVDLGTLGGPNSYFSSAGFGAQIINGGGTIAGTGDTSSPDPYAPNCWDPDCYLAHAFRWRNGVPTDLGSLPGT